MKITRIEEQGLRLVMRLGRAEGHLTIPEMARMENLSLPLVAKVLGKLKKGRIVRAVRGRNGGFELAVSPASLTISQILLSLGRPIIDGCFQENNQCVHAGDCSIRPVLECIEERVTEVLDSITLSALLQREPHVRAHLTTVSGRLST